MNLRNYSNKQVGVTNQATHCSLKHTVFVIGIMIFHVLTAFAIDSVLISALVRTFDQRWFSIYSVNCMNSQSVSCCFLFLYNRNYVNVSAMEIVFDVMYHIISIRNIEIISFAK